MRLEVLFAMEYILVVDCERRLQRIIAAEARRQFSLPPAPKHTPPVPHQDCTPQRRD